MPPTPTAVRLRRARPDDVPTLIALEAASFASDRLSARQMALHAAGRSHAAFVVAERRGEVLGNALVFFRRGSRQARLYSIVVAAAARGLGLGRRLLARAEREARRSGARRMVLEVRTGNVAAIALYESAGYARIAQWPGYYEDGADAVRLAKAL